jgi:hypothetical protein
MISRRQVTCISKREHYNPHERILYIGGSWGKVASEEAIAEIERVTRGNPNASSPYYVRAGGREVDVIVAERLGRKYLKTTADGASPDNLLALVDCG